MRKSNQRMKARNDLKTWKDEISLGRGLSHLLSILQSWDESESSRVKYTDIHILMLMLMKMMMSLGRISLQKKTGNESRFFSNIPSSSLSLASLSLYMCRYSIRSENHHKYVKQRWNREEMGTESRCHNVHTFGSTFSL